MSDTAPNSTPSAPAPAPVSTPAPAPEAVKPQPDAKVPLGGGTEKTAAPTTESKEAPKVEVDAGVSKRFAELERRKAAIAAKEKSIADAAKKAADAAKAEEPERTEFSKWRELKASKNPIAILKASGFTQNDLASALLNGESFPEEVKPDPVKTLQERIDAMERAAQEREAATKKAADDEAAKSKAQRDAEAMSTTRTIIKSAITADMPRLAKMGDAAIDLVFDTMTELFIKSNGSAPPVAKVAAEVEAFLKKLADGESDKPASKAEAQKAASVKGEAKPRTVTITNKTNADQPPAVKPSDAEENKRTAIANLQKRMAARVTSGSTKQVSQ